MLKIYIARHGQDEDNAEGILNGHRDRSLTALGRAQAQKLAEGIAEAGLTFDAVYTSPLSRAYQTAAIVCASLGLPLPKVLPDLIERDFGSMTGKQVADISKICGTNVVKTSIITYFLSPEGAELFPDLIARAARAINELQQIHPHGSVLVVTHGDLGKMMYAAFYGKTWEEALTMFHFGNSELLLLAHDSKPEDSHVIRIEQHNH